MKRHLLSLLCLLIPLASVYAQSPNAELPAGGAAIVGGKTESVHWIDAETPEALRELFRFSGAKLPIVSAHRGGAGPGLPENCLATFAATLKSGYAMIEIDPRLTRDGQIVIHHDLTLERTTTGTGSIHDCSLAELKELRLKDLNGKVTEYQIPTLDEVFQWAEGKAILVIDSKDLSIEQRVQQIEKHDAEAYAIVIAGGVHAAKECYELNPDIMMEVFISNRKQFEAFAASGLPWSNLIAFVGHQPTDDQELLKRLHDQGVSTIAGTSRNLDKELVERAGRDPALESQYKSLMDRGIDLIETDLPRRVWPLLYGNAAIPESKQKQFRLTAP